jgi:hypothetical protein
MTSFWRVAFGLQYWLLQMMDPLIRAWWSRSGIGNIVELRVPRRNGGGVRSRMVGILRSGGREYLGHPNGEVGWTRDLAAAGHAEFILPGGGEVEFRATRLPEGDERNRAIRATSQHPFPGNMVYRLGRRHVRAAGVFFRLDPESGPGVPLTKP